MRLVLVLTHTTRTSRNVTDKILTSSSSRECGRHYKNKRSMLWQESRHPFSRAREYQHQRMERANEKVMQKGRIIFWGRASGGKFSCKKGEKRTEQVLTFFLPSTSIVFSPPFFSHFLSVDSKWVTIVIKATL